LVDPSLLFAGGHNSSFNRGNGSYDQASSFTRPASTIEPSATIVIKGLPIHTTENTLHMVIGPYYPKEIRLIPQRENKGCFAFVEFISLEYAMYFMTAFAGSAGDPQAAQLIIENRSVTIEYARDRSSSTAAAAGGGQGHGGGHVGRAVRSDWLCEACGCHNFAKRDLCFRCYHPRTEHSLPVSSTSNTSYNSSSNDPFGDSTVACDTPSVFLVAKGSLFSSSLLPPNMMIVTMEAVQEVENKVKELFRQFAAVKSVHVLYDHTNHNNHNMHMTLLQQQQGIAYIEFYSLEHSAYALQCCKSLPELKLDPHCLSPLRVAYAREMVMQQLIVIHQQQLLQQQQVQQGVQYSSNKPVASGLVAQAMQAAQWSMNNGYSSSSTTVTNLHLAPTTTTPIQPQQQQQKQQQWPPIFETNGGAYLFQPKTGYFHEPVTDFYYSPKAKLYYSAKDGVYYRYDSSSVAVGESGFIRFDPPIPSSVEPVSTTIQPTEQPVAEESKPSTTTTTTKMSISLSGSKGGGSGGGAGKMVLGSGLLSQKKSAAVMKNIAKWGALQQDDDDDEEERQKSDKNKNATITADTSNEAAKPVSKTSEPTSSATIAVTTSTAPASKTSSLVCLLCKRQFNSAEMLSRHEKESKLHAENLAKQNQQKEKEKEQYHDRAKERRELYGSVPDHLRRDELEGPKVIMPINLTAIPPPPPPPVLYPPPPAAAAAAASSVAAVAAVPVHADESNPGNQIMRKLGWKEGQGLGRDGDGKEIAVGVELAEQANTITSTMHSTLKSTQSYSSASAGGGRGGGNYRESIQAAARARFEQLSKK